jgi:hypothetical protein
MSIIHKNMGQIFVANKYIKKSTGQIFVTDTLKKMQDKYLSLIHKKKTWGK